MTIYQSIGLKLYGVVDLSRLSNHRQIFYSRITSGAELLSSALSPNCHFFEQLPRAITLKNFKELRVEINSLDRPILGIFTHQRAQVWPLGDGSYGHSNYRDLEFILRAVVKVERWVGVWNPILCQTPSKGSNSNPKWRNHDIFKDP